MGILDEIKGKAGGRGGRGGQGGDDGGGMQGGGRVFEVKKKARQIGAELVKRKEFWVGVALVVVLAAPFALRPPERVSRWRADVELVVLTPHNETIRAEFEQAFQSWYEGRTGKRVYLDWRSPGGTSEIKKFVDGEYQAAFKRHWWRIHGERWSRAASRFNDRRLPMGEEGEGAIDAELAESRRARRAFLESDVGIGVDLFFGGGSYDFDSQARQGYLVSGAERGQGLAAVAGRNPEWFQEGVMPLEVDGQRFRDSELRWAGVVLSSFGICYNTDVTRRLGLGRAPETVGQREAERAFYTQGEAPYPSEWGHLGDPRYFRQIALADPTKSGSATKAFEMLVQQQMHQVLAELRAEAEAGGEEIDEEKLEHRAVRLGWARGLNLIQRIAANARYFSDAASKIPGDVAQGDAAAGMCIDFYGRTYHEKLRQPDGSSRVQYLTPRGGSAVDVDPVGMFRGAPNPEVATDFMEFLFSVEGQRLWNRRAGTPGGPLAVNLRRLPVRKDMFVGGELEFFTDPEVMPYDHVGEFVYRPEWTGGVFDALRFLIRVMCVEVHGVQRDAWEALIHGGFPPQGVEAFHDVSLVSYDDAAGRITDILRARGDRMREVELARRLSTWFRKNYESAERMAIAGR